MMPSDFVQKAAELILPQLVKAARVRRTITRKEIGSRIGISPDLQVPRALESIRETICTPRQLPDLTSVVIDDPSSPVPSDTERNRVFACMDWDRLLLGLNLQLPDTTPIELEEEGRAYSEYLLEHPATNALTNQALKEHIAEHPETLGLRTWRAGIIDHHFISGDTCDVFFDRDGLPVIAMATTRHRGDLIRGIYRLVMQRALLEAEKGRGESLAIQCFLASGEIPQDIRAFAAKFQISCVQISLD
jgi:hypothetical protein